MAVQTPERDPSLCCAWAFLCVAFHDGLVELRALALKERGTKRCPTVSPCAAATVGCPPSRHITLPATLPTFSPPRTPTDRHTAQLAFELDRISTCTPQHGAAAHTATTSPRKGARNNQHRKHAASRQRKLQEDLLQRLRAIRHPGCRRRRCLRCCMVRHRHPSLRWKYTLTGRQLRTAQALGPKGRHQEDHSLRPLHVLSEDFARNEAVEILQPREHHFHSRHSEAAELRDLH